MLFEIKIWNVFLVWREGGSQSDEFMFNIHARFSSIEYPQKYLYVIYPQKYLYVIYFSPTIAKELMIVVESEDCPETNFPILLTMKTGS